MGSCLRLMLLPLHFLKLKFFLSQKIVFEMGDLFPFSSLFQVSRVFFLRVSSLMLFDLKVSMNFLFGGLPSISPRFHVVHR